MMRKKIVSLCMALVLCLSLLPATALAADGIELYVGGQQITESGCYANQDGTWKKVDGTEPASGQFYYDAATATLTLNGAEISHNENVSVGSGAQYRGSVIAFSQSADVPLTIVVSQGTSTITGTGGIRVMSEAGDASLSISGSGSLAVNVGGNIDSGITLIGSKDANLNIDGADVTASSNVYGVQLQAGEGYKIAATINDGNLTASGSKVGFYYSRPYGSTTGGLSSLTVSGNAVVDTEGSTEGILNSPLNSFQVGADGESGGIVFNGKSGTVYGNVTLQENLEIGTDETLTIGKDASLTVPDGKTLTNNGTVTTEEGGTLTGNITNAPPKINTEGLSEGTVNTEYNQTLVASGDATITWSSSDLPEWLTLDSDGTISGTPTAAGTYSFTVTATNDYGSDSKEFTLTIDQQGTIHVTSVSLDKTSLELTEGETARLTATVLPETATNRNVTWSSNAPGVATVDSSGKVTAVAPGTATITVTTQDGNHTAACTVTVSSYLPPANPNYRITVEATQGGTVTADPTAAKAGATVTLTPAPDRGYRVGSVAVTDRFGDAVAVTEQADGTYTFTMPNGQVTVTVTFAETPLPFTDVMEGDWFYDAVVYAYETGLMDGVGDNLFAPNSQTTRAQLVTILHRLAGEPEPGGDSGFSDVAAGTWYTDAVAWAAENGIVNGTTDTTFAPGEDITREQLVTVLYRYAESKGYDVSASADLSGYPDAGQVQDYAQPAMAWAVAEGIVEGVDGTLNPTGDATRAQIATILMRFCEGVAK